MTEAGHEMKQRGKNKQTQKAASEHSVDEI